MVNQTLHIACTINRRPIHATIPVRQSLVDFLREGVGLTGSHVGCAHGVCGACHVVVDGVVVRGCLMLAVQADGAEISTIEHAATTRIGADLQAAFFERAALQCGFCTSGMILQAAELLAQNPEPSREEIRAALSGNLCRCTGYHAIVDAVQIASARLSDIAP